MESLLLEIQSIVDTKNIPPVGSNSRPIFEQLLYGAKRKALRQVNDSFHGSPLEDLEGEKSG